MSECTGHILSFLPEGTIAPSNAFRVVSDKPADVVDLTCPVCGHTLFLYYRHGPALGEVQLRDVKNAAYIRGNDSTQPPAGQEQQTKGNEK